MSLTIIYNPFSALLRWEYPSSFTIFSPNFSPVLRAVWTISDFSLVKFFHNWMTQKWAVSMLKMNSLNTWRHAASIEGGPIGFTSKGILFYEWFWNGRTNIFLQDFSGDCKSPILFCCLNHLGHGQILVRCQVHTSVEPENRCVFREFILKYDERLFAFLDVPIDWVHTFTNWNWHFPVSSFLICRVKRIKYSFSFNKYCQHFRLAVA